ncbi:MAG: glutathione S-transferase [Solirubrobacterales bacterium]|nr:glutathione S-transferase [Solirubrobacterales bacterium]MCB8969384.1 glutathione S-transferase [Thermoleophilales bacterium]MCO5327358.1 glutathione S-transferase [Solirubrobacterales bacterium]
MGGIRVHRVPFSTNVERVALAAGHKGIEVEWVDHADDDRSAVEALSGQPLVPVAEIDGAVIRGSMRIIDRLEEMRPEPALYPADRAAAARARMFVSWFDRVWKGPPNALDTGAEPPPDAGLLRRRSREWTGWIADQLGSRAYLGGAALGAEDVCAFPFLKYAVVDPRPEDTEAFHHILVELLRADSHDRLDDWVRRLDELPRA